MNARLDNVEFYRKKLDATIPTSEFRFGNHFEDEHRQDCCESVHADWSTANENLETLRQELSVITEVSVSGTPDMGFTVFFYDGTEKFGEPHRYGIFVPCYNSQNGYYSSNLTLHVTFDGVKESHSITKYVEDRIY